jgi:hypothetical protein
MGNTKPYPDAAVTLALGIVQNGGSLSAAARAVGERFDRRPNTTTVLRWTQSSEAAFAAAQPEKKREWVTLAGEVYEAWAARMLEAATAKKTDGSYAVSHAQTGVPFGISKDALAKVLDATSGANIQAIQINIGGGKGEPITEF